jgi:catechol 2,3-dioxygenase-like lactoylglutathione lyase family enzyme
MITGLNHLTLSVSALDRAIQFYSELLGFTLRMRSPGSAYLEAGTFWIALVLEAEARHSPSAEYSHAALSVVPSELPLLAEKLRRAGVVEWRDNNSSDSFYFLDPDGHKLELHSGNLLTRLWARAAAREPKTIVYADPEGSRNHK